MSVKKNVYRKRKIERDLRQKRESDFYFLLHDEKRDYGKVSYNFQVLE